MSQLTCQISRACWFTVDMHMKLNWKIEFFMCETPEVNGQWSMSMVYCFIWLSQQAEAS